MQTLIYVDCETTGLDYNTGHILELGMLAVSLPTFQPLGTFSEVLRPEMWDTVERNMHQVVRDMHRGSGLSAEISAMPGTQNTVQEHAVMFVQQFTKGNKGPIAGANPSFDRRWLEKHMPKLAARFSYSHFDVRTITFLQQWVGGEAFVESPHRALADCIQANNTVRSFLGLQPIGSSAMLGL